MCSMATSVCVYTSLLHFQEWSDKDQSIHVRKKYVSLRLRVQNAVPPQPCVGQLEISLVLLNFLHCNFR